MLTTTIKTRVIDNLNRNDVDMATRATAWINAARLEAERRINLDYMKSVDKTLIVTNAAPAATLPARYKEAIVVKYRKTLPAGEEELSWTEIRRLAEDEVLDIETYQSAGVLFTSAPLGYTTEITDPAAVSTITVHPAPQTGKTYTLALVYWRYSADWAVSGAEEPYLALWAPDFIIEWATKVGFDYLGEIQDAQKWEGDAEKSFVRFRGADAARVLKGPLMMRPSTGGDETRPSRARGWNAI